MIYFLPVCLVVWSLFTCAPTNSTESLHFNITTLLPLFRPCQTRHQTNFFLSFCFFFNARSLQIYQMNLFSCRVRYAAGKTEFRCFCQLKSALPCSLDCRSFYFHALFSWRALFERACFAVILNWMHLFYSRAALNKFEDIACFGSRVRNELGKHTALWSVKNQFVHKERSSSSKIRFTANLCLVFIIRYEHWVDSFDISQQTFLKIISHKLSLVILHIFLRSWPKENR